MSDDLNLFRKVAFRVIGMMRFKTIWSEHWEDWDGDQFERQNEDDGKQVSPRVWACAEDQRTRKAREKSSEGEGDWDKAGTNAKDWLSA